MAVMKTSIVLAVLVMAMASLASAVPVTCKYNLTLINASPLALAYKVTPLY